MNILSWAGAVILTEPHTTLVQNWSNLRDTGLTSSLLDFHGGVFQIDLDCRIGLRWSFTNDFKVVISSRRPVKNATDFFRCIHVAEIVRLMISGRFTRRKCGTGFVSEWFDCSF